MKGKETDRKAGRQVERQGDRQKGREETGRKAWIQTEMQGDWQNGRKAS